MIWESEYWKKPLLRLAKKVTRWCLPREWTERELVDIEKDIFVAFYSIRKLMEAKKLSDSTEIMPVAVSSYSNRGKNVTRLNWHHIDELYKLDEPTPSQRDLRFICNQVVHSYVFIPDIDEQGAFTGILFCSDRERNTQLYGIQAAELIRVLTIAGKDYPSKGSFAFNKDKRDYDIHNE